MFSVLILADEAVAAATRSLAALVPAAVQGVVGRVTLWSAVETPDLALLASEAGCEPALGVDLGEALERARHVRREAPLLALQAGAIVPPGWSEEAIRWRQEGRAAGAMMLGPDALARWRARWGGASTRRAILLAAPGTRLDVSGGHVVLRKRPTIMAGRFTR